MRLSDEPTPNQRPRSHSREAYMAYAEHTEISNKELSQILARERRDYPSDCLCSDAATHAAKGDSEAAKCAGRCVCCGERRPLVDDRQAMCAQCQRRKTVRHGRAVSEAAARKRATREAERRLAALQERIARDENCMA